MLLAITIIPLMCAVGAVVDFSRINSTRTAFQVALDSTELTLTKQAQVFDASALTLKAEDVFNALFSRPEAHDIALQTKLNSPKPGSFDLTVTGSAKVDTIFGNFLGQKLVPSSIWRWCSTIPAQWAAAARWMH